jgi:hypothetical protein
LNDGEMERENCRWGIVAVVVVEIWIWSERK